MGIVLIWGFFIALYWVSDLPKIVRRSILTGFLYGLLAGVVLGPIAMFVFMEVRHGLYGERFPGLELEFVAGSILGAIVLPIPGAIVGTIRGLWSTRHPLDVKPRPLADQRDF